MKGMYMQKVVSRARNLGVKGLINLRNFLIKGGLIHDNMDILIHAHV